MWINSLLPWSAADGTYFPMPGTNAAKGLLDLPTITAAQTQGESLTSMSCDTSGGANDAPAQGDRIAVGPSYPARIVLDWGRFTAGAASRSCGGRTAEGATRPLCSIQRQMNAGFDDDRADAPDGLEVIVAIRTVVRLRAAVAAIQMSLVESAPPPAELRDYLRVLATGPGWTEKTCTTGFEGNIQIACVALSPASEQEAGAQLTERNGRPTHQLGLV